MTKTKTIFRRFYLIAVLIGIAALLFVPVPTKHNQQKIVATFFPAYDVAKILLQNTDHSVSLLIQPGVELHDYDPTPQDIIDIKTANLVIYNGGESDHWLQDILTDNSTTIKMISAINNYDEANSDEHIWTSPKNIISISNYATTILCDALPSDCQTIRKNNQNYTQKLQYIDAKFTDVASHIDTPIILASHSPFAYLESDYKLNIISTQRENDHNAEPPIATIANITKIINQQNIQTIYALDFESPKTAETIASTTNAKISILRSAENISQVEIDSEISLIDLFQQNIDSLSELLK